MLELTVIDLGPNNTGTFGPDDLNPALKQQVIQDLAKPEYSKPASNTWICVDGRSSAREIARAQPGAVHEADNQIAGSKPISETAADMMTEPSEQRPVSVGLAENTKAAVANGDVIIVHGDDHNHENGCAANRFMRPVLLFSAENADVIAPKVWAVAEAMGLDKFVTKDDVTQSILNGKQAADKEELWDVTPKEAVEIMVANGAEYEEYQGPHFEATERISLVEDEAFDKTGYAIDHSTPDRPIQAFAASVGKYVKDTFERAEKSGQSEREAALKSLRVAIYNVGLSKMLITELTQIGLIHK